MDTLVIIMALVIGILIGSITIFFTVLLIVPDRYESLIDEIPCDTVSTYLNENDAGIIVTELLEAKIKACQSGT